MVTAPLMVAEVTGTVAQFWACVAGLKVSGATAGSPSAHCVSAWPAVVLEPHEPLPVGVGSSGYPLIE